MIGHHLKIFEHIACCEAWRRQGFEIEIAGCAAPRPRLFESQLRSAGGRFQYLDRNLLLYGRVTENYTN